MKKLIYLLVITVLIISCKKEEDQDKNSDCSTATYEVKINENTFIPIDIKEDSKGNAIVLGSDFEIPIILKYGITGELLWRKEIQTDNKAKDLLILDDDSFVILYEGEVQTIYTDTTPDNIWVQNSVMGVETCIPTYEMGYAYCFEFLSTIEIVKYNQDGISEWSKILNDFTTNGKSLTNHSENSFLLLSAYMSGLQPEYVYDSLGVFMDTVNFPFDKNKLFVYKFTVDGNIMWKTDLEGIYNTNWGPELIPYGEIINTGGNVHVKSKNYIISLDDDGTELSRLNLNPEICIQQNYFIVGCTEESYVVSGNYYPGYYPEIRYTKCISNDGTIIWEKDEMLGLMDGSNGFFTTYLNGSFKYFNDKGDIIWGMENINIHNQIMNCNNGITFIHNKDNNYFFLRRTDENGNFIID